VRLQDDRSRHEARLLREDFNALGEDFFLSTYARFIDADAEQAAILARIA
jgi:hypothetical protein